MRKLIIAAVLAVTAPPVGANNPFSDNGSFKIAGWQGWQYPQEGDSEFSHCSIGQTYEDATTLIFTLTRRGGFGFSLYNKAWTIAVGKQYEIELRVDGRTYGTMEARGLEHGGVGINLPNTRRMSTAPEKGYRVTVVANQAEFRYQLT